MNRTWLRVAVGIAGLLASVVQAETPERIGGDLPPIVRDPPTPAPALFRDREAFAAFTDRFFSAEAREKNHVVGGVMLAVNPAGVTFEQGFGVRDLQTREPVQVNDDVFFIASVSKTFVGTAVMRLVQQHKISLDDDLRKVIKSFRVPDRFGQPILVRHALTHTTGIVDRMDGTSARTREDMIPLVELFRRYPAEQIAPPGKVTSYCNYCIAMLAVAIQDVTGMDYRDFLLQEVLQPLGMRRSAIILPPMRNVRDVEPHLVSLYLWNKKSGEYTKYPPMFRSLYPNGSLASTAPDMGRYMRMFLNEGTLDGQPFLQADLVRQMLAPHDWPNPSVPTFGLSLKYGVQNGVRYLGHSGNYRGTDTSMVLFPDYGFGYFLSYTGGNSTYHRRFLVELINEAFPSDAAPARALPNAKERVSRYTGRYTDFRFRLNTPMAFAMLFPGQTTISANDDGSITLQVPKSYFDGGTVRYVEVKPNRFRKVDSGDPSGIGPNLTDYLVFLEDDSGHVRYFTTAVNNHAISGVKAAWYQYLPVALTALAVTTGMFIVFPVGLMLLAIYRRIRATAETDSVSPVARFSGLILSISAAAFVMKYLVTMTAQQDWTILYSFRALGLHYWFALPLIAAAATVVLMASLWPLWAHRQGRLAARIVYSALAVAGVVFTLQMAQYRVLDYYW